MVQPCPLPPLEYLTTFFVLDVVEQPDLSENYFYVILYRHFVRAKGGGDVWLPDQKSGCAGMEGEAEQDCL